MLMSMTGFGRSTRILPSAGRAVVEIQTLNHRFLDLECRLPEGFLRLEQPIRAQIAPLIRRGKVRVSVNVRVRRAAAPAVLNDGVARRYAQELRALKKRLKLAGDLTLTEILSLPHVFEAPVSEELLERWAAPVEKGVAEALVSLVRMRRKEGANLERTLKTLQGSMERLYRRISRAVPAAQRRLSARWEARLRAEVPSADPADCVKEAALLIRETDVGEEIARIGSHLTALRRAIDGTSESPGRTMDFLAQEFQREVNTLGVKIRDGAISRQVVEMKGLIEKLREQAANVE